MLDGRARQRQRHDFRRQDEVRADRTADGCFLDLLGSRALGFLMFLFLVRDEELHQLFRSFKGQIDTADHQKRHDEGWCEIAEDERQRQQDDELCCAAIPW